MLLKMLIVNNSILSSYERCERLYEWKQYHPRIENIHLSAGKALAEAFYSSRLAFAQDTSAQDAENIGKLAIIDHFNGIDDPLNKKGLSKVLFAFERSNATFPLEEFHSFGKDGKPCLEFSFVEPLPLEFQGEPVLYSGAFDAIRSYGNLTCGHDDKSSLYIGPKWPEQWSLRGQFIGYAWGAQHYGIKLDGFIIRGVPIAGDNPPQETIIYTPSYLIREWLEKTVQLAKRLLNSIEEKKFYPSLGDSCNAFGGCMFREICSLNPENRLDWLQSKFESYEIDPLTKARIMK